MTAAVAARAIARPIDPATGERRLHVVAQRERLLGHGAICRSHRAAPLVELQRQLGLVPLPPTGPTLQHACRLIPLLRDRHQLPTLATRSPTRTAYPPRSNVSPSTPTPRPVASTPHLRLGSALLSSTRPPLRVSPASRSRGIPRSVRREQGDNLQHRRHVLPAPGADPSAPHRLGERFDLRGRVRRRGRSHLRALVLVSSTYSRCRPRAPGNLQPVDEHWLTMAP